jgi:hypothetical protein
VLTSTMPSVWLVTRSATDAKDGAPATMLFDMP